MRIPRDTPPWCVSTGTLVIPHSPSFFRQWQAAAQKRRNSDAPTSRDSMSMQHRENDKMATELFLYAVIYWTLFGISRYFHIGRPDVSHHLVRLSFQLQ